MPGQQAQSSTTWMAIAATGEVRMAAVRREVGEWGVGGDRQAVSGVWMASCLWHVCGWGISELQSLTWWAAAAELHVACRHRRCTRARSTQARRRSDGRPRARARDGSYIVRTANATQMHMMQS